MYALEAFLSLRRRARVRERCPARAPLVGRGSRTDARADGLRAQLGAVLLSSALAVATVLYARDRLRTVRSRRARRRDALRAVAADAALAGAPHRRARGRRSRASTSSSLAPGTVLGGDASVRRARASTAAAALAVTAGRNERVSRACSVGRDRARRVGDLADLARVDAALLRGRARAGGAPRGARRSCGRGGSAWSRSSSSSSSGGASRSRTTRRTRRRSRRASRPRCTPASSSSRRIRSRCRCCATTSGAGFAGRRRSARSRTDQVFDWRDAVDRLEAAPPQADARRACSQRCPAAASSSVISPVFRDYRAWKAPRGRGSSGGRRQQWNALLAARPAPAGRAPHRHATRSRSSGTTSSRSRRSSIAELARLGHGSGPWPTHSWRPRIPRPRSSSAAARQA